MNNTINVSPREDGHVWEKIMTSLCDKGDARFVNTVVCLAVEMVFKMCKELGYHLERDDEST